MIGIPPVLSGGVTFIITELGIHTVMLTMFGLSGGSAQIKYKRRRYKIPQYRRQSYINENLYLPLYNGRQEYKNIKVKHAT